MATGRSDHVRSKVDTRLMAHFAAIFFSLFFAIRFAGPAQSQDADDSLRVYGVHIDRTPKEPWIGYGIYLGNGVVLTAAHVVGRALLTQPRVEIAGQDLPATLVKAG